MAIDRFSKFHIAKVSCLYIAVAALLWLNGIGCAICCSADLAGQSRFQHHSACGASRKADCCIAAGEECGAVARKPGLSVSRPAPGSCSLLPRQIPTFLPQPPAMECVRAVACSPSQLQSVVYRAPGLSRADSPANRGSTYLRCCACTLRSRCSQPACGSRCLGFGPR